MYPFHRLLKAETAGDTLIVSPCADGIGFRYADLQTELNRILRHVDEPEYGTVSVVVDLSELHYSGTEFVGAVVTLLNHASRRGGKAVWCNATPDMQAFLEERGIWKLWPYFVSRDEALAASVT